VIRSCDSGDLPAMLAIINDAAQAYRGAIPEDRWHDPYMHGEELEAEIRAGVRFHGLEKDGSLVGVIGIQDKGDVLLVRHAYVRTADRHRGVGTRLLQHLQQTTSRPLLVGTWADARWAIRFYEKNGFRLIGGAEGNRLLRTYWSIPEPQIDASVVLANAAWNRS